jgi:hypothetical protein
VSKRSRRSMRRVCTSIFVFARETGCSKRIQAQRERDAVMFRRRRAYCQSVGAGNGPELLDLVMGKCAIT